MIDNVHLEFILEGADRRPSCSTIPSLLNQTIGRAAVAINIVAIIALKIDQNAISTYLTANSISHLIPPHIVAVHTRVIDKLIVLLAVERLSNVATQRTSKKGRAVFAARYRINVCASWT